VTTRRTSLRATLDLLAHDLAEAVLRAVRSVSLTELAELPELPAARSARSFARPVVGARVPAPRLDLSASAPARSARPRSVRAPRPPRRAPMQQLELLPHVEAYADVVIDDPAGPSRRPHAAPGRAACSGRPEDPPGRSRGGRQGPFPRPGRRRRIPSPGLGRRSSARPAVGSCFGVVVPRTPRTLRRARRHDDRAPLDGK
jgi:hypothetical protein